MPNILYVRDSGDNSVSEVDVVIEERKRRRYSIDSKQKAIITIVKPPTRSDGHFHVINFILG